MEGKAAPAPVYRWKVSLCSWSAEARAFRRAALLHGGFGLGRGRKLRDEQPIDAVPVHVGVRVRSEERVRLEERSGVSVERLAGEGEVSFAETM